MKTYIVLFVWIIVLAFAGCGGGDSSGTSDPQGDQEVQENTENTGDEDLVEEDEPLPADEESMVPGDEEVAEETPEAEEEVIEQEEEIEEETDLPPRRGSVDDLPTDSISCFDACTKMDECGHLNAEPLESLDACIFLCEDSDNLPFFGDAQSNEYFQRCASVEDDCDAIEYCGDWLYDPRTYTACWAVGECLGAYLGKTETSRLYAMLAPEGMTPAPSHVVARKRVSMDLRQMLDEYGVDAQVESNGRYVRLRFMDYVSEAAAKALERQLEVLPTYQNAWGVVVAATERVIVQSDAANDTERDKALAGVGLDEVETLHWTDRLYAYAKTPGQALGALKKLRKDTRFKANMDWVRFYEAYDTPDDPLYPQQWHLHNTGENESVKYADARVWEAWVETVGSSDVVVGVNDDGCDLNHEEFDGKMADTYDFPDDWESRLDGTSGFGGHGTCVAGVAAAQGFNALGGVGVCPNCGLRCSWTIDTEDSIASGLTDAEIAEKFTWHTDQGTAVVNNSWGPWGGDPGVAGDTPGIQPIPDIVEEAFEYAESTGRGNKGMVIVFASGNSNEDVAASPLANYENSVAVAAVDDQGLKSFYSNWGEGIDIAAPSNGGMNGIVTASPSGTEIDIPGYPGYTKSFGGTSSASPFVSGVVGLIISANPELTAAQVRDILKRSARKIDPLNGEWDDNGHSIYYGWGMVDAYVAVKMAADATNCATREDCLSYTDRCTTRRDGTCERAVCEECANDGQCASGHCQALIELGMQICVETCANGETCSSGLFCLGGVCLPPNGFRTYCNMCETEESAECNGRDNDCDGTVDKAGCTLCHDDTACEDDTHCAYSMFDGERICRTECATASDCPQGTSGLPSSCVVPTYRYGQDEGEDMICLIGIPPTRLEWDEVCGAGLSGRDDQSIDTVTGCVEGYINGNQVNCMGIVMNCLMSMMR